MARTDDEDREARQVETVARGYLALAAGDAGRALRMLATDRLAETTRKANRRRQAINERFVTGGSRRGCTMRCWTGHRTRAACGRPAGVLGLHRGERRRCGRRGGAPGPSGAGHHRLARVRCGASDQQRRGARERAVRRGVEPDAGRRTPDAGGQAFYLEQLASGVSRSTVALEIAESAEAQVHLVGVIENGFQLVG